MPILKMQTVAALSSKLVETWQKLKMSISFYAKENLINGRWYEVLVGTRRNIT